MKETEVKILEVNPTKIRNILKKHKAKLVMPKNLQGNYFYANKEIDKKGVIRLRKNILGNTIAFKSKVKFVKGVKTMEEHETRIENIKEAKSGLKTIGLKQIGAVEVMREDWKLYNCLVSIMKFPKMPELIEIEGSKPNIKKVANLLGYTEKDYYPKMIYDKYKIKTKFLKFRK
ncbi:MAG: CYTH domain-containing protein [archaeon]